MLLNKRRPHHDSRSNGLKSLRTGLGGSTQYNEEAVWDGLVDDFIREAAKWNKNKFD